MPEGPAPANSEEPENRVARDGGTCSPAAMAVELVFYFPDAFDGTGASSRRSEFEAHNSGNTTS